jgi:peptide/nickel transport system substrate-binding protein
VGGISNVSAAPTTAAPAGVQPGGTITFLKGAEIASLDPIALPNSGTNDGPPAMAVFDLLVYSDPTDGFVKAQTASSLTSSDALVWTLKLRPNIKFSDGTPYDAAAVKFNWQRLQDPNNKASRAATANQMQSMDVVDPLTLKITLKSKNAVFPSTLTLIPFIGSPTAIQQSGASFASKPVGAGPFLLQSWVRDSQMTFARNPNYWNAPEPYVDQLIMKPIVDEQQKVNTFLQGGANMLNTVVPDSANQLTKAGATPYPGILNGGTLIYFNTTKPPFSDIRARQAVTLAIDRADYAKVIDAGAIDVMDSIFRKNSPFYDTSILQPAYDATKAQQLFDQIAADTGGPLTFTLYTFNVGNYVPGSQYIQGVLNKFRNVKVSVEADAVAQLITRVNTRDFGASMFGNPFDDPEPTWTTLYTCDAAPSPTGWCDPKFDADIADNRLTLDPNKRIADLKDAQKEFYAQLPAFYFERRETWIFATPAVQNVQFVNDGLQLFDRVWMKTR